jgi:hypothetical protein
MKTPTHEEVAQAARTLWLDSGCAEGRDTENWLKAEQRLVTADEVSAVIATSADHVAHIPGDSPAEHAEAEIAAEQRHEARAPVGAHKSAPHAKPPESGKPLWNQPHSR